MGRIAIAFYLPGVLTVGLPSLVGQETLHEFVRAVPQFGVEVANAGDVDGDGISDLIAGSRACVFGGSPAEVVVYSGGDGSVLHTWSGGFDFGVVVDGAGDTNGDGHADLLVGDPVGGIASLYSGLDGSLLHSWSGDRLGAHVSKAGDVDGDGHGDVLVATSTGNPFITDFARVFSGIDGSLIRAHSASTGTVVSDLGDVNNDGHADYLVGRTGSEQTVSLYSGIDGDLIRSQSSPSGNRTLRDVGDLDSDGVTDFAIGNPLQGTVTVHSGATGAVVLSLSGSSDDSFGFSVDGAGDVNGDGTQDLLVAEDDRVTLFSGSSGAALFRHANPLSGSVHGSGLAGLGDLDADGLSEYAVASPMPLCGAELGHVNVHRGNDLYLDIIPDIAAENEPVTEIIREGVPGNRLLYAITAINEVPMFVSLGIFQFDSTGTKQFDFLVPFGLSGSTIDHVAFAKDATDKLIVSGVKRLTVP